jgi:hypothetical protein
MKLLCALFYVFVLTGSSSLARADEFDKAMWMGNAFERLNRTNNLAYWWNLNIVSMRYSDAATIDESEARRTLNILRWSSEKAYKNMKLELSLQMHLNTPIQLTKH